ncbi:hypothetical protein WA158_002269 [Blastocystis sp. Blastoise]
MNRILICFLFITYVFAQVADPLFVPPEYENKVDTDDVMNLGGGTQQTCDACRTVMENLLAVWRQFDIEQYKYAEQKSIETGVYTPMYPDDKEEKEAIKKRVIKRFVDSCSDATTYVQYKSYVRKTCESITKEHSSQIADIIVDKNSQLDTEIVNYLTRVVCMGFANLCKINYLNIDTTHVKGKCGNCLNVVRLLEYRTRRASVKYINRGLFFDNLMETFCEDIPTFYSHPSQIGSKCEELLNDYDEEIPRLLKQYVSDPKSIDLQSTICIDMSHSCTKKQLAKVNSYDYKNAMSDFQQTQNFKKMNMEEYEKLKLKDTLGKMAKYEDEFGEDYDDMPF